MSSVVVEWNDEVAISREEVVAHLEVFGDLLPDPFSGRMDLEAYAEKLMERGMIARARRAGQVIGFLAMYANDSESGRGYLPLLAVLPGERGSGIGQALLSGAISRARQRGMRILELDVDSRSAAARRFYEAAGFVVSRETGNESTMRLKL